MSRRKQSNPKAIKGEKDAMQPEQNVNSDVKCQQNCHDASYLSAKDNSDFEDDAQRLVIDTSQILPPSPSLTSGRTISDDVDQFTETSVVAVSIGDIMSTVEHDVVEDDVASKSHRDSVSSNITEKDNMSVSDCNSNGELSLNLSNSSVTDMTLLSDGSGVLKNSLSKSRKKSDLILPKPGNNGEENFSCPICEEVLPNNHEFTCHIRSHNSPTNVSTINTCTICGKVLSSQSSLDRHMLVHSGERPFRCKVCDMAFTTNGNMHRHMRIHEKNFQSINGAALPNGSVGKPRQKKKLLLEKRDPASVQSLPLEKMADVHLALWIQNGHSSLSGGGRKRKLDVSEDDGVPKEQSKKVAQEAGAVPKRLVLTGRNPSNARKRPLIRTMKLLPLATTFQRVSSIDPNRSPMKCSECQQTFFSKLCLANDLEEHERRRGTSLSIFCIACKKMIHGARQFRGHLMSAHVEEKEVAAAATTTTTGVIAQSDLARLEFTGRNFPLVAKLYAEKSARRQATKDLPYCCEPCERSFMCEESLAMHLSEHAPNHSRLCVQCGTYARTHEQSQQHELAHESETVVTGFTKRSAGKVPEAIQDGISPQEFMLVLGMRPTDNSVGRPHEALTGEATNFAACGSLVGNNNNLSLDDNQNLVRVISLGEQLPVTQPEASLTTQMIPSLSLLSILPKIPGRLTAKPTDVETGCSSSLAAAVSETSSGICNAMFINKTMTEVPYVGQSSPTKYSNLSIPNREFILPRIEVATKVENGSESTGSGASGSSTKASLPFKCSECSYSSTDKSTLLRHERKHNGQRPFLCRICDFAFTTKANCERHIRKKHPMREGQRLEDAIGYTRFATELGSDSTLRSMLETVCKFCGEDFKFYRALKHHLRSQTSCQYKPCQCKICSLRFSTKANCWRHLLKKHAGETVGPIESYMFVNSRSRLDESHDLSIVNDEAGNCSNLPNMKVKEEVTLTLPGETVGVLNLQKNAPNVLYPVLADDNEDSDEPLDFSLKSQKSGVAAVEPRYAGQAEISNPLSCDEPIDLTVKGHCHQNRTSRESETATLLRVKALPFDLKSIAPEKLSASQRPRDPSVLRSCPPFRFGSVSGSFSCAKCHLVFPHERELSAHLRTHRTSKVSMYRCSHCSYPFASRAQLNFHVKSRHPQFTDVTSSISPRSSSSSSISLLKEPNNNSLELTNANLFLRPKYVGPSQMLSIGGGDLASVPKILESTSGRQLKPILAIANPSVLLPATTKVSMIQGQSNLESFAGHTFTITTAAKPAITPIVVQKYDDEDDDSDRSDSVGGEKNQNQETKEMEQSTESHIVKKKRNSYADSPHKLHCSFCSRAFPWISSLKRHLLTHTGQKPYRCKHCTVTFSTKSNRERHMIRKHGLDVHDPTTRQTMDRPFKCHLCVFSSFTTSGKLLRHYISKHPDREIPETVTQSTGSQSQDESDRASRSCSSDPSFETSKLDQPADLSESLVDEDDESQGDETDEETKEVEELTNSLIRDMNQKAAGNIVHSVATSADVMSMVQLFAQEQTTSSKPSSTSDCLLLLSDKHVNPERDNYNVDKITECWKCQKAFDCRKTLLRHLKEHSIDLPFKCYLCDASFEDRLVSLTHKRDAHPTDWATVQDKNRVSDLGDYADFMESVVRDTLDGKVTRRTHEGVELDIKPESDYAQRKVFCTLCPKRFWSLQDLRRHMRSHTGDRPFECDICFTRFTLKHSMMRHRRKHLNESVGAGVEAQCSGASDEESINNAPAAPTEAPPNGFTGGSQLKGHSPDSLADCNSTNADILLAETELDISSNQVLGADVDLKEKTSSSSPGSKEDRDSTDEARLVSPDQPDLLQSLLGIDDRSTIDRMLESPNNAASMLGIQRSTTRGDSAA